MESSLSEVVPLSAEDAELPDMVPVSIRTTLPEFQHCSLERVLAGLLLTWKEFLQLFDVRFDAKDFVIRGSNGVKADLDQKIGDYVNTFRRKLKIYPVTLERASDIIEISKGQRVSSSEVANSNKNETLPPKDNTRTSGSSKKLKLMDEDKRKRNHRKSTKESLEKIAQSVVQGHNSASTSKRSGVKKGDIKRGSIKSRTPTPPPTDKASNEAAATSAELNLLSTSTKSAGDMQTAGGSGKLKRLSTDHSQVKDIAPSSSSLSVVKRGRKPRKSRTLSSRRSTKESNNTAVSQQDSDDDDSSDSDIEETPTKEKKKLLKQNVIKMLTEKVSPRTFLRLRDELMALRDQEKYFKVTSVVPLTAGMMEQAFCRRILPE